jgi:FtsZ-binding cell division protein ZapB
MSTVTETQTSLEIFDDLTLKISHVSGALDCACTALPDKYINVVSTLRLLQQSLEEAKEIAGELYQRVPS